LAMWTGLAVGSSCLVKTANIALLCVAGAAVVVKILQLVRAAKLGRSVGSLVTLVFSVVLPIGVWVAWNAYAFGDLTGAAAKIEYLGWTRKPIGSWLPHPIFTPRGLMEFWPALMV